MNILLFTGAGASVELGIPDMRRMVEEFHSHLKNLGLRGAVLGQFERLLPQSNYDMEQLIEKVESLEKGQESLRDLDMPLDAELLNTSRMMRWEAEWFVQHVCERLREADARILWGPLLRGIGEHELCVATTNYDRAIETACSYDGVTFDDGFHDFSDSEIARWKGIEAEKNAKVKLLKVHGSTDWYLGEDGSVYKLRHPMPLYGDLALSYTSGEFHLELEMKSAMILPTREKRITQPPYPDLTTDFRNISREVEVAFFVGTSLRDPDLRDICRQCATRIPTYLVTIDPIPHEPIIPSLSTIRETASMFLTSTLPKFLRCVDFRYLDSCVERTATVTSIRPVLMALTKALRRSGGVDERCEAIDDLVDSGVMLDLYNIKNLLAAENDEAIRKYALALIPKSVDSDEAMALARHMVDMDQAGAFYEELRMMEELIES